MNDPVINAAAAMSAFMTSGVLLVAGMFWLWLLPLWLAITVVGCLFLHRYGELAASGKKSYDKPKGQADG